MQKGSENQTVSDESAALHELIRREIESQGPITFARFMELALYHPDHGYYERRLDQIGQRGDYYTSVSVGSLFGKLLAADFCARLEKLNSAGFDLVECGAHDGTLAADILTTTKNARQDLHAKLQYVIIEPSPRRRAAQRKNLAEHLDRVSWCEAIDDLGKGSVHGVVFANELLDSFPFHRLRWSRQQRQWHEDGVGCDGGRFVWVDMGGFGGTQRTGAADETSGPGSDWHAVCATAQALAEVLPDGFRLDYCPGAARWWRKAATALAKGALMTIDYGLTREELFSPHRHDGTARAYYRHAVDDELLAMAGEKDITAHVDFSALIEAGEAQGLITECMIDQATYIMRILQHSGELLDTASALAQQDRTALVTLVHPSGLGRAFRVLSQVRGG
ncbi:MAG: SAM-dependent methyltransferase [Verrucomicrobiota bacterium]|nr:SAM-dependent methyltransferase [Verrucomicrobiota bacterium]